MLRLSHPQAGVGVNGPQGVREMADYEKQGFVSLWAGTNVNPASFERLVEELFDDDGDMTCRFWAEIGTEWIDHDFREVLIEEVARPVAVFLEGASYLDSFRDRLLEACTEHGLGSVNAVILVYDMAYDGHQAVLSPGLRFIGAFAYTKS